MMPSGLVPVKVEHLRYLAAHARPDEREQWEYFTGKGYDPEDIFTFVVTRPGPSFAIVIDGTPIAAGGYYYESPGVWSSWMLGTVDGWRTHWRTITKAVRWLMDGMFRIGALKLETHVQPSRTRTCEWFERSLRMRRESESLYVRTA